MEAKQTEIERLIYDSKEYLKRNHFGEYTLLYILNKDRVKGSPYQYAAVASTDEARLFSMCTLRKTSLIFTGLVCAVQMMTCSMTWNLMIVR